MKKTNQIKFFQASRSRLEELLDLFPSLCSAVIGPFCCRSNSTAEAWMIENGKNCSEESGWAHTFFTDERWSEAKQEVDAKQENGDLVWEAADPGSPKNKEVENYLRMPGRVKGVMWRGDLGFVRVEDLFPTFTKIFADASVDVRTRCHVRSLEKHANTVRISVEGKSCDGGFDGGLVFDRVIVTAGAASVQVVKDDKMLYEEVYPVKGFACATNSDLIPIGVRGIGVQHEEYGHYIRPQANGGVRYGFGKVFGVDDSELLDPKYDPRWEERDAGIGATDLGQTILNQHDVMKLAGIRPLSYLGNFPLLKQYTDSPGVILNTGFGWHGFVMCWKSAEFAVDLALNGNIKDSGWEWSWETDSGCGWDISCHLRGALADEDDKTDGDDNTTMKPKPVSSCAQSVIAALQSVALFVALFNSNFNV